MSRRGRRYSGELARCLNDFAFRHTLTPDILSSLTKSRRVQSTVLNKSGRVVAMYRCGLMGQSMAMNVKETRLSEVVGRPSS